MASPYQSGPTGDWNGQMGNAMPPSHDNGEPGLQTRSMGLKVHYTFDAEGKVNCLARYPHTLQVQTLPLDESTTIGVVNLQTCIQAVTQCSPELAGQETDFTVYALDYSEPEVPFVGQGMLSWALEPPKQHEEPKMVTGRVTKNLLGVFGKGNKEILEVKLKLSAAAKLFRVETQANGPPQFNYNRPPENALTPTSTAEWSNFMQMNPQIGHGQQHQQPQRVGTPNHSYRPPEPAATMTRSGSFSMSSQPIMQVQMSQDNTHRTAPMAVAESLPPVAIPPAPSRPSSRASNKSTRSRKAPTGRPRGRPRKKVNEGNTSGYEDGTEGEDGGPPAKKRAKITQVGSGQGATNSFVAGQESSLRVTASTSSSLRNFRPIGANAELAPQNHLQEVPRAPTPVPNPMKGLQARNANRFAGGSRRPSTMSQEYVPRTSLQYNEIPNSVATMVEDERSPDSIVQTPVFSEDSPGTMRSSPPAPRTSTFLRSSPPPSSPGLPPMPQPQTTTTTLPQDASFMTDDMDLFGEDSMQLVPTDMYSVNNTFHEQVFRVDGQAVGEDLGRTRPQLNTPQPTSTPAVAIETSAEHALPAMKSDPKAKAPKRSRAAKKPAGTSATNSKPPVTGLAPTPPSTTDAVEHSISPDGDQPSVTPKESQLGQAGRASAVDSLPDQHVPDQPTALQVEPEQSPPPHALSEPPTPKPQQRTEPAQNPRKRPFNRSQSAGALALPAVPASEPVGPSTLSSSMAIIDTVESEQVRVQPVPLRRAISQGLVNLPLPLPASEPIGPIGDGDGNALPPPSSPQLTKSNKNLVKKKAIKQRLEEAIMNGEMPPFCTNCGAIETPTWRKTYIQEHEGVPEKVELSAEPGRITAIEILTQDDNNLVTTYRVIKKSLGPDDVRADWREMLVCNPCGIWLVKSKSSRPESRWAKDQGRLGQERRRRPGCKKRPFNKKDAIEPTSEAFMHTDALEGVEPSSPKGPVDRAASESQPGTTHSRGQGTAKSPVQLDDDDQLGTTKRLLFPSPRKEGEMKVLSEVNINIVQTPSKRIKPALSAKPQDAWDGAAAASNAAEPSKASHPSVLQMDDVLKTPQRERATTPPPRSTPQEPFKTPTRPTPSHRPVTRSVTRSRRSEKSFLSPRQCDLPPHTPSKTPRLSASLRRSPRFNHANGLSSLETPLSRQISQLIDNNPHFGMNDWSDALEGNEDLPHLQASFAMDLASSHDDGGGEGLGLMDHGHDFSDLPELSSQDLWDHVENWQNGWD